MNNFRALLTLCFFVCVNAHGFEIGTHGMMTKNAYQQSVLATNPNLLTDMGFPGLDSTMPVYFDGLSLSTLLERTYLSNAETNVSQIIGTPYTPQGWMIRGSIREDDAPPDAGDNSPNSKELRVLNHFYDPINDSPLTVFGITPCAAFGPLWGGISCAKNPDWALGTANRTLNRFTILDAREAQYRALTGFDSSGNQLAPVPGGRLQTPADIRKGYWATMFRALGDVSHLVQDMAQPQHTRNEAHSDKGGNGAIGDALKKYITGQKSIFETYLEQRAIGKPYTDPNSSVEIPALPLTYTGYPIPTLTSYRDFFTTRSSDNNVMSRRGLADYSNRGFFSAAKNIGNTSYQYPSPSAASYQSVSVPVPNAPTGSTVQILNGSVTDSLNPAKSVNGFPMAAYGVWDEFLQANSQAPSYSLNKINYDAMADQLVPRAVAYSTGLINYFFRGQIDLVPDTSNPGTCAIKNMGTEDMSGTFALYYDDANGERSQVPGASWNLTVPAGQQVSNVIIFTSPNPATAVGVCTLVFKGVMGQENMAVVGEIVQTIPSQFYFPMEQMSSVITQFPGAYMITPPQSVGNADPLIAASNWASWYDAQLSTNVDIHSYFFIESAAHCYQNYSYYGCDFVHSLDPAGSWVEFRRFNNVYSDICVGNK